jgi:hypothetical protein
MTEDAKASRKEGLLYSVLLHVLLGEIPDQGLGHGETNRFSTHVKASKSY